VNSRLEEACRRLSVEMQAAVLPFIEALASASVPLANSSYKAGGEMVPLRTAWPLWMTSETAAQYLDFGGCKDPKAAFRKFVASAGLIPRARRGRIPLWARRDLDSAVIVVEGDR
jgi:hypothetical protein